MPVYFINWPAVFSSLKKFQSIWIKRINITYPGQTILSPPNIRVLQWRNSEHLAAYHCTVIRPTKVWSFVYKFWSRYSKSRGEWKEMLGIKFSWKLARPDRIPKTLLKSAAPSMSYNKYYKPWGNHGLSSWSEVDAKIDRALFPYLPLQNGCMLHTSSYSWQCREPCYHLT